jgi:hypothetical protein
VYGDIQQLAEVHTYRGVTPVGVKWGQMQERQAVRHMACSSDECRSTGQVGQESNLQPAVLEHAARCPTSSKVVKFALESTGFGVGLSNGVQVRPAGL